MNFTQEAEDDVLVDRDIKRCGKSAVNIAHSPRPGIIRHRGGFHHVTPSVPEESATSAHAADHVDELAVIPDVGLGVSDELGTDVVPGFCSSGLAFVYDGGMGRERVEGVAGNEEVEELPSVPGPDFGADGKGHDIGGEMVIQDPG